MSDTFADEEDREESPNQGDRSLSAFHVEPTATPVDPRNPNRADPNFEIRAAFPGDSWDVATGDVYNMGG